MVGPMRRHCLLNYDSWYLHNIAGDVVVRIAVKRLICTPLFKRLPFRDGHGDKNCRGSNIPGSEMTHHC